MRQVRTWRPASDHGRDRHRALAQHPPHAGGVRVGRRDLEPGLRSTLEASGRSWPRHGNSSTFRRSCDPDRRPGATSDSTGAVGALCAGISGSRCSTSGAGDSDENGARGARCTARSEATDRGEDQGQEQSQVSTTVGHWRWCSGSGTVFIIGGCGRDSQTEEHRRQSKFEFF